MIYVNVCIETKIGVENMKYQQRIKDLRADKDLTQSDIAKLLGTTQQYYGQYEIGKRPLTIEHLIKLCKFYNVSADYLLGFTDTLSELPKK